MLPPLPNSLFIISCVSNQLTSLPSLPNALNSLGCSGNQITNLPPLPSTLVGLVCNSNQLTSLPTLPSNLITLWCAGNQLTFLPALPNNLDHLDCSFNQLTTLPALPNTLQWLSCTNNQLTSIPTVPNLMQSYKIANNNILCVANLPQVPNSPFNGMITNTLLTCVPNQTWYSLGLPLCLDNDTINNPNSCPSANIAGHVYLDLNGSCDYNISDLNTENIPVKLLDSLNNLIALSYTANGDYSFNALPQNSYQLNLDLNSLPITMACGQTNNISLNLDSSNQTITDIDFLLSCEVLYDLKVQYVSTHGIIFPGQVHYINTNIFNNLNWYNISCDSSMLDGTVSIEVTGPVNYVSPLPGALIPAVSGNIFNYNIIDFNTLNANSFGLIFNTDTTAQLGNQICVHVEINPANVDADITNNVYDFCYQVVNSYDPNMKEVYPVNVLPGYNDWFTYTIHFQNTGTAPAFNIRLRDTLDNNLDINTFEMLGYSHPANILINGNILTVRFNDIMLPDSTTDYEGSMGYFQYRIKPKPNQPLGTQIKNTAYIYFDYNAPIITNTTQNNFVTGTYENLVSAKNEFILYPNPSNGIFNFKDTKNLKQVEVYNLLGAQILAQGNQKQINLSGFAKGIYYARINGEVLVKLVKD
jgi:uncharacterized repeat protein (TIGR01451 family)